MLITSQLRDLCHYKVSFFVWGNLIEWKKRQRLHTQNLFHKVSLMKRNSCIECKGLILLLCILTPNNSHYHFSSLLSVLRGEGTSRKKKKMGYLLYFTKEWVLILGFVHSFSFVAWLKDLRYPAVTEEVKKEPEKDFYSMSLESFFSMSRSDTWQISSIFIVFRYVGINCSTYSQQYGLPFMSHS